MASNGWVPSNDGMNGIGDQNDGLIDRCRFFQSVLNKQINVYGKHQLLATPWKFWRSRFAGGTYGEYIMNLKAIYTAYTTATFWTLFDGLPPPSRFLNASSLHVMRDMRKPLWTETGNIYGGAFRLRVKRKDLNAVWKTVLLATIGEQISSFVADDDEVCGVSVLTLDKEDAVIIWNTRAESAGNAKVFECVQRLLPDTKFISMIYTAQIDNPAFGDRFRLPWCTNSKRKFLPIRDRPFDY
ncbi:unnamed protein product [Orchesella dallaii]|uniref:Eukaryotic translation initiation factor 4E type 3 n=1 Tax=Orchesella dallaii TaxID=48710 RepID=A0ABP1PXF0_9HEXA